MERTASAPSALLLEQLAAIPEAALMAPLGSSARPPVRLLRLPSPDRLIAVQEPCKDLCTTHFLPFCGQTASIQTEGATLDLETAQRVDDPHVVKAEVFGLPAPAQNPSMSTFSPSLSSV